MKKNMDLQLTLRQGKFFQTEGKFIILFFVQLFNNIKIKVNYIKFTK